MGLPYSPLVSCGAQTTIDGNCPQYEGRSPSILLYTSQESTSIYTKATSVLEPRKI